MSERVEIALKKYEGVLEPSYKQKLLSNNPPVLVQKWMAVLVSAIKGV